MVVTTQHALKTQGHNDTHDITRAVQESVTQSKVRNGTVTVFVPGSTAGITTIEFEPGAVSDLSDFLNGMLPEDQPYKHNKAWDDDNGFSHLRAALIGPSLTVPVIDGKLGLGTWQQIVLVDFDNRPRERTFTVTVLGD